MSAIDEILAAHFKRQKDVRGAKCQWCGANESITKLRRNGKEGVIECILEYEERCLERCKELVNYKEWDHFSSQSLCMEGVNLVKITEEMLRELATEEFDPIDWIEENFEEIDTVIGLLDRVNFWTRLALLQPADIFLSGLSIGVQLGRRLAQIEMLNEKVDG